MAIFRNIQMSFWTDPKIADDFTPEDRYFYLYLMTNPHTNLCGCYEISIKQMADETGYNKASIEKLVTRLETVHRVITYSHDTKELLLVNWSKYNWTASEKFRKPLLNEIQSVKNPTIKAFLMDLFNGNNSVLIPYPYGSDTTDTVTDTITDTVTVSDTDNKIKHIYGEYKNVRLTDEERNKLMDEYGEAETSAAIKYLDEYIEMKGYKAKSHYLCIKKWVFDTVDKDKKKQPQQSDWLTS